MSKAIKKNSKNIIVFPKSTTAFELFKLRNKTKPKEQITIALSTIALCCLIYFLLIPPTVNAAERPEHGVDFNLINWEELSSKIEPIAYKNCNVVHPTFIASTQRIDNGRPMKCQTVENTFHRLLADPKMSKFQFKNAFNSLVLFGDIPQFTAEEFRDKYLIEGIIDIEGIAKSRAIIGK